MNKKEEINKEISMDDLARLVQNGFMELKSEFKTDLKSEIGKLKDDIEEIKNDTSDIRANLNKKVDRLEHNELTYRVERLEKACA